MSTLSAIPPSPPTAAESDSCRPTVSRGPTRCLSLSGVGISLKRSAESACRIKAIKALVKVESILRRLRLTHSSTPGPEELLSRQKRLERADPC
jgi:hypothetical protein